MKKAALILIFAGILLPLVSYAAIPKLTGPFLSCSGAPAEGSDLPKCTSVCDILSTGKNILDFTVSLLLFVIAPLMFVYGGLMILVSGGNPGLRSKGIGVVRANIIAILIVMAGFVIVNTFVKYIGIQGGYIKGFTDSFECKPENTIKTSN